jgi:hypothetical protein
VPQCAIAAAASVIAGAQSQAGERARAVVVTGTSYTVNPAGVSFVRMSQPVVDSVGSVLFKGQLAGAGVSGTNDTGVWGGSSGASLRAVLVEGGSVPGVAAPATYGDAGTLINAGGGSLVLAGAGRVAVQGAIRTGTLSSNTIFAGTLAGGVQVLTRGGQPIANSSETFVSTNGLRMNAAGKIAFSHDSNSVWAGTSAASLTRLAAPGQTIDGKTVVAVGARIVLTQAGEVGFVATPSRFRWDLGSASFVAGTPAVGGGMAVAAAGQAAPGVQPAATFAEVGVPSINASGGLAIAARAGSSGTSGEANGVWLGRVASGGGGLTKLLQAGELAPGASGARFSGVREAHVGPSGRAFVEADLTSGGSYAGTGVWVGRSAADLKLLLRSGQPIKLPGFTAADTWGSVGVALNAAEQAVFSTRMPNFRQALVGYDPSLGMVALAATGDSVEVAPGVTKVISSLTDSGDDFVFPQGSYNDGQGAGLNDRGVVAYRAVFTDNSQAILTTRVPVAGDATFDGVIDAADLRAFVLNWGKKFARPDRGAADFNLDGAVDLKDFQLLERNFGRRPPGAAEVAAADYQLLADAAAAAVPEPAGGAVLAAGVAAAGLRRRRRRA